MKPPSMLRRVIITLLIVVGSLVVGLGAFQALSAMRTKPVKEELAIPLVRSAWLRAKRSPYLEWVRGTGRALAHRRSTVSAEVTGVVSVIEGSLRAGSTVHEGDILIRLEDGDYAIEIERAKARIQKNELEETRQRQADKNLESRLEMLKQEMKTASTELLRLQRLAESDAASASAIESQLSVVAALSRVRLGLIGQQDDVRVRLQQAAVDRLELSAVLAAANRDLARCTIRAPYDGEIETVSAEKGERVAPGGALFAIVDASQLEIAIRIPASRYGEIKVGAVAELRSEVEGRTWKASVTRVGNVVTPTSSTFTVFIVLDNRSTASRIADGLFLDARIHGTIHEDVVAVPRTAFVGDRLFILTPDADHQSAMVAGREPTIRRALASYMLVSSGVEQGEQIAVTNVDRLANGGKVLMGEEWGAIR